jgi:hypothetical protein
MLTSELAMPAWAGATLPTAAAVDGAISRPEPADALTSVSSSQSGADRICRVASARAA